MADNILVNEILVGPHYEIQIPQLLGQAAHVFPNNIVKIESDSQKRTVTIYGTLFSIFNKIPYDILQNYMFTYYGVGDYSIWLCDKNQIIVGMDETGSFISGYSDNLMDLMVDPTVEPYFYDDPPVIEISGSEYYLYGSSPIFVYEGEVAGTIFLTGRDLVFDRTSTNKESLINVTNLISVKLADVISEDDSAPVPPNPYNG